MSASITAMNRKKPRGPDRAHHPAADERPGDRPDSVQEQERPDAPAISDLSRKSLVWASSSE